MLRLIGSEFYCLIEDRVLASLHKAALSTKLSRTPSWAGRCWLAGSREPAVPCCTRSLCLYGAALSRMLLPGALELIRGWHGPVQSRNCLIWTNTPGVLLSLEPSFSPHPIFNTDFALSSPDDAKKLVFSRHHPLNPTSPPTPADPLVGITYHWAICNHRSFKYLTTTEISKHEVWLSLVFLCGNSLYFSLLTVVKRLSKNECHVF